MSKKIGTFGAAAILGLTANAANADLQIEETRQAKEWTEPSSLVQAGKAISAEQDRVSKAIEAIGGESYEKYKDCWDDVIKEGEYPEDHCKILMQRKRISILRIMIILKIRILIRYTLVYLKTHKKLLSQDERMEIQVLL